jgi:hypothetical protein
MLVWGDKKDCDLLTAVLPDVFALLPPPTGDAPPPLPLSDPGVMEHLMRKAGLSPVEGLELASPLVFTDHATAIRAVMSAMARAIRHAGEEPVRRAIADALARIAPESGPLVLKSRFRILTATRASE